MITQHLTHEDDINWYHEQTLSDGTAKTVTIPKPTPPIPWVSWRLIATNDQPVQVEYVYLVTREDQTTFTNAIRRVKTQRERAEITLPPMPVIARPDPGAADVYGHIAKQAIEKKEIAITERKTMAKRDVIESRIIVGDQIRSVTTDGKLIITPLQKLNTARVKSVSAFNFNPGDIDKDKDIGTGDSRNVPKFNKQKKGE